MGTDFDIDPIEHEQLKGFVQQIYNTEVLDVPENVRALMPKTDSLVDKIVWMRTAKAEGHSKAAPIDETQKAWDLVYDKTLT